MVRLGVHASILGRAIAYAAGLGTPLLVHLLLTEGHLHALHAPLRIAALATHGALYCGLLAIFGRTLLPGREALVSRLARRFEDPLPPVVARYTRGVTWAWTLFAAGQLLASAALFRFAAPALWSLFVNALELPLLAAMFAGEYACRLALVPSRHRVGAITAIRAFATRDDVPAATPP